VLHNATELQVEGIILGFDGGSIAQRLEPCSLLGLEKFLGISSDGCRVRFKIVPTKKMIALKFLAFPNSPLNFTRVTQNLRLF
jgi:hypothetical protein